MSDRLADIQTHNQLTRVASGTAPPLVRDREPAVILKEEVERLNFLANNYADQADAIHQDKRYSDEHKRNKIDFLKAKTLAEVNSVISKLYGDPADNGDYDGGLIQSLLTQTQADIDDAKVSAETEIDATRLTAAQNEIGGSLSRFNDLDQLRSWFENEADEYQKRAMLSCRDRIQDRFRQEPRLGSFLRALDDSQNRWQETEQAQMAQSVAWQLDREIAKAQSSVFWSLDLVGAPIDTGPFSGSLSRRIQSLSPRSRNKVQVPKSPLE